MKAPSEGPAVQANPSTHKIHRPAQRALLLSKMPNARVYLVEYQTVLVGSGRFIGLD